jgi:glycosyltransferase involved in cell wall biosynthesis
MKVLQFEIYKKTGGIESFLLNLNSYLHGKVDCEVICPYENSSDEISFSRIGTKVIKISETRQIIRYIIQINKIMKNGKYDVVHMNKCSAINIIPILIAYKNRIPIIIHSHNSMTRLGVVGMPIHMLNRWIIGNLSKKNLACSDVAGKWMFGNRRYTVIKNGINTNSYLFDMEKRIKLRNEWGISEDKIVFTNLGDLRKQKNPILLISIFNMVCKIKDAVLMIVGDGILREEMEQVINNNNIEDKVFFLGHRLDVSNILNAIDCLLMPSLYEGLPMSCIEAQASGMQLFLSDTISKEVEVTKHVHWFSLNQSIEEISDMIATNCTQLTESERKADNLIVRKNGFDYEEMSQAILENYNNTVNKR